MLRLMPAEVPMRLFGFYKAKPRKSEPQPERFSFNRLHRENSGLAAYYGWGTNPALPTHEELWLHLGCGVRVFDGFVNLDVCPPPDPRIIKWNLLDLWPEELEGTVSGAFSEDCFEHFFFAEQTYILCNLNRSMKFGGVARILMPNLARLINCGDDNHGFLKTTYGAETKADAINYGARFTGHRWLHDQPSFNHMANLCGFHPTATTCSASSVAKLSGLNLRDESTLSFATDLRKARRVRRHFIDPAAIYKSDRIETISDNMMLYVANARRPAVEYILPRDVDPDAIICINFRSSNLSCFDWPLKTLVIGNINKEQPWHFDETLKSQPCMNLITKSQIKIILGTDRDFSSLEFSPADQPGQYFTLGCAEIFTIAD